LPDRNFAVKLGWNAADASGGKIAAGNHFGVEQPNPASFDFAAHSFRKFYPAIGPAEGGAAFSVIDAETMISARRRISSSTGWLT